jgi:glucokinase
MTRALVGDIGGTNARFALVENGGVKDQRLLLCADHATIEAAISAYLLDVGGAAPESAAIAVACPVTGDRVTFTNSPWSFSIAALRQELGLERLEIVNDFAANALAVPHLGPEHLVKVGAGAAVAGAPIGVIGPGSGLGVGGLVPAGAGWIALAGEGGHATMPPTTERESALLDHMRRRYDHVSAERVLSGPGLVNLYNILAELDGVPAASFSPAQVTDPTIGEQEPLCREAVDLFCAMLGTVAGNLALTFGARGGVYIAGGIVPKLGQRFVASSFRERFEAKGRFRPYLAAIPTFVITHPVPAFVGLAGLLRAAPSARSGQG